MAPPRGSLPLLPLPLSLAPVPASSSSSKRTISSSWSDETFDAMSRLWNLSDHEKAGMRALEQRLSDVIHWKSADPFELIRYYKEYNGHLDTVERKFRSMLQWRKDHNMESFLQRYGMPQHSLFHQLPVCVLQGVDKEGDPIYLARIGASDFYPLLQHLGADAVVDYVLFIRELTNHPDFWKSHYEQVVGHRVRQYTVVFDLDGLGPRHLHPSIRATMKRTSRISQNYYAGWCKRILYIRAPAISTYVWGLVKHLFDPSLQEKMQVAGHSNYLTLLDQYMDRRVLPPEICPDQGKGCGYPGYFQNINLQGGPIPSSLLKETIVGRKVSRDANDRPASNNTDQNPTKSSSSQDSVPIVSAGILLRGSWDDNDQYFVETIT